MVRPVKCPSTCTRCGWIHDPLLTCVELKPIWPLKFISKANQDMRKLLFLFPSCHQGPFRKFFWRIRGKTEQDIHDQRIVTGQSWSEFCDELKVAGNVLLSPGAPRDAFQQAEGIRYLSRLTRAGLEAYVEYPDPAFPQLRRMVHETVKMGADNPDNHYMNAQVSGEFEYKILGKRNSIDYISFHTQNGNYGTTGGLAPCGKLEDDDLVLEENGNFEIFVTREPQGKNWLKIEEETSLLMVRQTFYDRFTEVPAQLEILNLSGIKRPEALTSKQMDEGLENCLHVCGRSRPAFCQVGKGFPEACKPAAPV